MNDDLTQESNPEECAPSTSPINGGETEYKRRRLDGIRIRGLIHLREAQNELRNNSTKTEMILWKYLKNRRLDGLKFRRQHGVGPYIVDFYCDQYKLIIEVDGRIHDQKDISDYDKERQGFLEDCGYKVLRVTNSDVKNQIDVVLERIKSTTPSIYGGG